MKNLKHLIIASILTVILTVPAFSQMVNLTVYRPYTPPNLAFNVYGVDTDNEPVLYANQYKGSDGYYYVGVYEGVSNSASLIRLNSKEDSEKLIFYLTMYVQEYLEFAPIILAYKNAELTNTTVEENLAERTKQAYFIAIDWINSTIEASVTQRDVDVYLALNGAETSRKRVTCDIGTDLQTILGKLKWSFETEFPRIRNMWEDVLEIYQ